MHILLPNLLQFKWALPVLLLASLLCAQTAQFGPAPRLERPPIATGLRSTIRPPQAATAWVDISSRAAVLNLYKTTYLPFQNVALGWTGDVATGNAGDTSSGYKNAVISLVNFFRSMAGVRPTILDLETSRKAQLAALMFAANDALSHNPPSSWMFYTADGAEAASRSNICLGTEFTKRPGCVERYIEDSGDSNTAVGHRRWILYPQTTRMGTGDVPPGPSNQFGANDLWVINSDEVFGPRPATREEFVAWPPPGYVPQQLVFDRWSFSLPDADFTNATVAMTRGGATVPVQLQPLQQGFGENTIVWTAQSTAAPTVLGAMPAVQIHQPQLADVTTHVTVSSVVVSGTAREFSYDVTAFDTSLTLPEVSSGGIVSAASYRGEGISPGEILTLYGFNLGPANIITLQLDQNGRLAKQLGPTRVLFDGLPGPMIYALSGQVSAIAPFSIAGKQNVNVQVEFNGVLSSARAIPVLATKPAIFTLDQSGMGQGAILNQDFSVNGTGHTAAHGSVIQIFLTGGGTLDKPSEDGEIAPASPLRNLVAPVRVRIGGIEANVQFGGAAPFIVLGVVQVNAFIPNGVSAGDASVEVIVDGVSSQPGVTVAIGNN